MSSIIVDKIVCTNTLSIREVLERKRRIYTFLNPVSYLLALDYKQNFAAFDGLFVDGSILVAAIKLCYGKTVIRRSFDMTSLAPILLSFAELNSKTLYIVASKQSEIEKAVSILCEHYPKLRLVGYRNGYFTSELEMDDEVKRIVATDSDFLIVGMGTLVQENFLLKVKEAGYGGIGFTCGGFVHQTSSDEINYYPSWVDKMNLRFMYRMYKEKHTRKRYIQAAFLFPARFIYERFFCK